MLRRLVRSESGAELIEFALTLPLLLLVVLGMIEFGFLFREYEVVTNAAREGARIAGLPAYSANPANAKARAEQYLAAAGLTASHPAPTVGAPVKITFVAPAVGCVWTTAVTVTYPHPFPFVGGIIKYFGGSFATVNLSATSAMRTEVAAGAC
jgi:Flp pilus assembly protein TadG